MTHRRKNDFTDLGENDFKLVEGVFQVRDLRLIEFSGQIRYGLGRPGLVLIFAVRRILILLLN